MLKRSRVQREGRKEKITRQWDRWSHKESGIEGERERKESSVRTGQDPWVILFLVLMLGRGGCQESAGGSKVFGMKERGAQGLTEDTAVSKEESMVMERSNRKRKKIKTSQVRSLKAGRSSYFR